MRNPILVTLLTRAAIAISTASATATAAVSTAAAATTTTVTAAATTTATAAAFFARSCFRDRDIPAVDVLTVERADGCLRFFRLGHGHKRKAAWTARHAIGDEVHVLHNAVRREEVLQTQFGRIEGKISDE